MSAKQILEQYRDGDRQPVPGPFTYVEALGLVTVNQKLLAALKEVLEIQRNPEAMDSRVKYYNACAVVVEAEAAA